MTNLQKILSAHTSLHWENELKIILASYSSPTSIPGPSPFCFGESARDRKDTVYGTRTVRTCEERAYLTCIAAVQKIFHFFLNVC